MEFGRLERKHIENINFSLPPDDPVTEQLWQRLGNVSAAPLGSAETAPLGTVDTAQLRLYVGGTEWGRASWVGSVYPRGTKPKDFLAGFSRQFNTVELNTLFYGLQPPAVIQRWASMVGEGFRFCPKFPEMISHKLQLSNAEKETREFVEAVHYFAGRLGPSFLQLSDRYGPEQAAVLQQYVRQLPEGFRVAVELRSENWFGPAARLRAPVLETFQLFGELGIGTVITDVAGRRDVLHMRLTTPVAFIRFVTNGLHPKDYVRADAWVERIRTWAEKGLQEVYFFVHSPEELTSPEMMSYVIGRMNERCGVGLPLPNLVNGGQSGNLSLF
jgi:uncharacterized protein YecE (DUF72 family)